MVHIRQFEYANPFSMKEVYLLPLPFSVTKEVKKSFLLTPTFSSMMFYGNCDSCFSINYDPGRHQAHDKYEVTQATSLPTTGSVSKQLLDVRKVFSKVPAKNRS